ncbi:hypothetical protein [Streptomyces sp. NPDC046887]|uniref:hypothetical protein n=1 Tax=Streptomyces sp. NPDC046887 TaxID=3155472 RepID=UPI0033E9155B
MPGIETRATAVASMLQAATDAEPVVTIGPRLARIEVALPDDLGPARRQAVLFALDQCDRYGHDRIAERATVWAEIDIDSRE